MKLISLKCPSCGAKLEVNESLEKFTCNFCGVTTMLDDESIVVKNISSKLESHINELKDYYENGNYEKCYKIAEELKQEYPKNEKIQFYYQKAKKHVAIAEAKKLKEKYENGVFHDAHNYGISGIDYKNIQDYLNDFPKEKIIIEAEELIRNWRNFQKRYLLIVILIPIFLFAIVFITFAILGI